MKTFGVRVYGIETVLPRGIASKGFSWICTEIVPSTFRGPAEVLHLDSLSKFY